MAKQDNEALYLSFLEKEDEMEIHNIAYLTEKRRVNPWIRDDIFEFLQDKESQILIINAPDGTLAGFIAYHEALKQKKLDIVDMQIAPDFAEKTYAYSMHYIDESPLRTGSEHSPKTVASHLLRQLLGVSDEGIKLDFSHIVGDDAINHIIADFGDKSCFITPANPQQPGKWQSRSTEPVFGWKEKTKKKPETQKELDDWIALPERVAQTRQKLIDATGVEWKIMEWDTNNRNTEVLDPGDMDAGHYYFSTVGDMQKPYDTYLKFRRKIGIGDQVAISHMDFNSLKPGPVLLPVEWANDILRARLPAGSASRHFIPSDPQARWQSR